MVLLIEDIYELIGEYSNNIFEFTDKKQRNKHGIIKRVFYKLFGDNRIYLWNKIKLKKQLIIKHKNKQLSIDKKNILKGTKQQKINLLNNYFNFFELFFRFNSIKLLDTLIEKQPRKTNIIYTKFNMDCKDIFKYEYEGINKIDSDDFKIVVIDYLVFTRDLKKQINQQYKHLDKVRQNYRYYEAPTIYN